MLRSVFSWFGRGQASAQKTEAETAKPGAYAIQYLASDGTVLPSAEGSTQRREIEAPVAGIIETRFYNLRPEQLTRRVREGIDVAGCSYLSRVTYWPWGQEKVRVETYFTHGIRCVEYQSFFENGDLKLHKKREGNRMTMRFAYVPPRYWYAYVEQMPVYPGGPNQLLEDVKLATKYPARALRNQEEGKVFVAFDVQPNGLLANIRIQTGVTPALDAAALQAVRNLGEKRWRPGFQNRRAVTVSYTIPITFALK